MEPYPLPLPSKEEAFQKLFKKTANIVSSCLLPLDMKSDLEELGEEDEDPYADETKEAGFERVVPLVAILKRNLNSDSDVIRIDAFGRR